MAASTKIVIPNMPSMFKIAEPLLFDDTVYQKNYVLMKPADGNNTANLNDGNTIVFSFSNETKFYSLGDAQTGFWITVGFRTRDNTQADAMGANITLANMWWAHMFETASFRLGTQQLETINNLGVALETLAHVHGGEEFRYRSGEAYGFIPDSGSGAADKMPITGTVTVAAGDTAANTNAGRPVALTLQSGNEGYYRRLQHYNYTVANNATTRFVEVFIPLRMIFGCCTPTKCLKGVDFEISLKRKAVTDINNIFFGAANTNVLFDGANKTGIQNMVLQVVEYVPHPDLSRAMTDYIKDGKLVSWAFRSRDCRKQAGVAQEEITVSTVKTTHPDWIYIVCKGTAGNANQNALTANFSLCRHCDIQNITVDADGVKYPNEQQNASFTENIYAKFYEHFKQACRSHRSECAISAVDYKNLYTIFAVDCSNHPIKQKNMNVDTSITIKRKDVPADNAVATDPQTVDYYVITENQKSYLINCVDKTVVSDT